MNEIWNKRREKLEEELTQSALNLFDHMGDAGACKISIPGTSPEVFIVVADDKALKSLIG
jgi:hypothetical protein